MQVFKYTARDPATGKKVKSEVQADSQAAAAKLISQQGLAPIDIESIAVKQTGLGRYTNRVRTKDKILFSRQLSTLINAGLPIIQGLNSINKQTTNKRLKSVISQLISDVEAGSSFSAALSKHPDVFNNIFVGLVAAGETSGTLDKSLERLATQQEKDAEIISKVRGAFIYPVIVIAVMVAVVAFMVLEVLPQVKELYRGIPGVNLPFITRILLGFSDFTRHYWWIVAAAVVIFIVFIIRWRRTASGREVLDGLKLHTWPFNNLFMKLYMARFARTGTTLVASGVPLLQMLDITSDTVNNVHLKRSILQAADKVKGGKALSEAIANDPNFLELMPNMLRIGEQSGAIETMLAKVAEYYEKEVDEQIKNLSTILEPILIVVIGIVAMGIVAAVLLPIYGLVGQNLIH